VHALGVAIKRVGTAVYCQISRQMDDNETHETKRCESIDDFTSDRRVQSLFEGDHIDNSFL
jgi:hypothetical protein